MFEELASRHSDFANTLKMVLPEIPSVSMITRPARHPLHFLTVREQVLPLKKFVGRPKQVNWKNFFWKILSGRMAFGKSSIGNLANLYVRSQSSRSLKSATILTSLIKEKSTGKIIFALSLIFIMTFQLLSTP